MKKTTILTASILTVIVLMAFGLISTNDCMSKKSSGAFAGYAGDPAGNNQNCKSCHHDAPVFTQPGWITSDIPVTGYLPNTTYTITASVMAPGHTRFGFEISPQNNNGTFLGTLVNTSSETQLTSNPAYITHTSSGVNGSGMKTWSFNWIAPDTGSGSVTFYGAFNITNANNLSTGDTIMLSTLTVNEAGTSTGTALVKNEDRSIILFPNPATENIYFKSENKTGDSDFVIFNENGVAVMKGETHQGINKIEIKQLSAGVYFMQTGTKVRSTSRFIKK